MIALLSYPRSGSSYTRYLLGVLTKSIPLQPDGESELIGLINHKYDRKIFTKFHFADKSKDDILRCNKLVLLYRDPIENILSFMSSDMHIDKKEMLDDQQYLIKFVNDCVTDGSFVKYASSFKQNIEFYRNWGNRKTIIRYEEIVQSPRIALEGCMHIFGFSYEDIDKLMDNIEYHRNKVLEFKSDDHLRINTAGKSFTKFRDSLKPDNLRRLEEYFDGYFI